MTWFYISGKGLLLLSWDMDSRKCIRIPNMNTAETNIVSGINYYNSVTKMKFSLKLKEYLEVVIDSDSTGVN